MGTGLQLFSISDLRTFVKTATVTKRLSRSKAQPSLGSDYGICSTLPSPFHSRAQYQRSFSIRCSCLTSAS